MQDLRRFLDILDNNNQLTQVEGADWDLEIGPLSEIVRREGLGSALLFDGIPDSSSGFRVLTNALDTPLQFSAAFDYPLTNDLKSVITEHKDNVSPKSEGTIEKVSSGPVTENVLRESEIDIDKFPAPYWHEGDGGKYIGTGDAVITRHRDTGSLNAGTYRVQVHDKRTATVNIEPDRDGAKNRDSYLNQDEPAPVVVSLGHAPDLFLAAAERTEYHKNELKYLSARRGEPLKVIPGEVTDLPIPSRAELVFEGYILPNADPINEGPFGEYSGYYGGYYGSGGRECLPFRIDRVYHRDDPIVLGYNNVPIKASANSVIKGSATLWKQLEESGISGIDEVHSVFPGSWFQIVSIEQQNPGHSTRTGLQAISVPAGAWMGRITVIVDEDIDVYDLDEVLWAMTTRFDPAEDAEIIEDTPSGYLDPRIPDEQKKKGDLTNSRLIIDATKPYHWIDEFAADSKLSSNLEAEIQENYADLFDRIGK